MSFGGPRFPPRCPPIAQAAITGLGAFVGRKKGNFDVLALQHIGNQRCRSHVTCIKSKIQFFIAIILSYC